MALATSYPVSAAVGVGPPGTSSADYGLLGRMGLSAPYTPMVGSSAIGWKPPIHGVFPTAPGAVLAPGTAPTTPTTPITVGGGFVSGIPGGATLLGGTGIPMPVVPGYKYVYPWYRWRDETSDESAGYELAGTKEDRDVYDYFPYLPGKIDERAYDSSGSALKHMLVGVSLIRS